MWNLNEPIVVVDVETTGLQPWNNGVVSLGAVLIQDRKIISEFYSLSWPGKRFFRNGRAEKALRINGLKIEDLVNAPRCVIISMNFWRWLGSRAKKVTAFNVNFDSGFLSREPWDFTAPHIEWDECIMMAATQDMGDQGALPFFNGNISTYKWARLEEAEAFYKISREGDPHNALSDAKVAAEIMLKIEGGI